VKILVLAPHPFFQNRGTPIAVRALLQALGEAGHAIDLATYHEGEDLALPGVRHHRIADIGVRGVRPGFSAKKLLCDVALTARVLALVRTSRPDLVHAVEEAAFIALLLKRLLGIPFVYDMDSSLAQQLTEKYPRLRRIDGWLEAGERLAVRESLAVVAVCKSIEDTARSYDGEKPVLRLEDFSLLRTGQDATPLAAEFASVPRPRAMYVGNLEPYQGIDLLLGAFSRLVAAGGAGSLAVVGGEPADVERYAARARELGLAGRVLFAGSQPLRRLGAVLDQADVVVSPRIQGRNTPMKIYSYLDSRKPLVATRLETHTQLLDDSIACLVEPEPGAMAEALGRLFRDPREGAALATRARARVEREFTFDAFRSKVTAFYDRVGRDLGAGGGD